ncbi:6,7-dimethyl-8-ribityllumazine synthase [Candidatus Hodgkinia cicadicola]
MLFLVRDLRVLILVSCCHFYLTDLLMKRLNSVLVAQSVVCDVVWFFGAYELSWLLKCNSSRYCAYVVLGFVLKGVSAHNKHIVFSVYNNASRYPVVNAIYALDFVELAWRKAFEFNVVSLLISLRTVLSASGYIYLLTRT